MIIAIDGPAGAGKSSVAQEVARRLELQYVDTGAIYRSVAWFANEAGIGFDEGPRIADLAHRIHIRFEIREDVNTVTAWLEGGEPRELTEAIRTPLMSQGASKVSAHPEVRAALLELQRSIGGASDSLLEGRDIGTVVFPDAEVKIYLTATPEVRAGRRREQMIEKAGSADGVPEVQAIAADIRQRDERDSSRAVAPLKPAEDGIVLDTTDMPFEVVVSSIVAAAREAIGAL